MLDFDNLDQIMALAGTNDDEDFETQLNKVAQLFTTMINQFPQLKMDNCTWKVEYLNNGEEIKFSKMNGSSPVSWVIVNTESMKVTYSNPNDEDLKKIAAFIALGILGG